MSPGSLSQARANIPDIPQSFPLIITIPLLDIGASVSMIPDPADEPTISVQRTAAILGVAKSAAYVAVQKGQIPAFRIGRQLRVPTAWLVKITSADQNAIAS